MDSIKDCWGTVMDAIMDGWGAVLDSSCRIVLESQFNSSVVQSTSDVSWALSISPVGTFNQDPLH